MKQKFDKPSREALINQAGVIKFFFCRLVRKVKPLFGMGVVMKDVSLKNANLTQTLKNLKFLLEKWRNHLLKNSKGTRETLEETTKIQKQFNQPNHLTKFMLFGKQKKIYTLHFDV